jgi:hypothetical protein
LGYAAAFGGPPVTTIRNTSSPHWRGKPMSGAGPDYAVAQGWFEIDRSGIRIRLLQRIAKSAIKRTCQANYYSRKKYREASPTSTDLSPPLQQT